MLYSLYDVFSISYKRKGLAEATKHVFSVCVCVQTSLASSKAQEISLHVKEIAIKFLGAKSKLMDSRDMEKHHEKDGE